MILPIFNQKKENIKSSKNKIEEIKLAEAKSFKRRSKILSISLPFLIIIPLIIYEVLAISWTAKAEQYVYKHIDYQMNSEQFLSRNWSKGINTSKGFTVNSIDYYYSSVGNTFYISPNITIYSDNKKVSKTDASLITYDLCVDYNVTSLSAPLFAHGNKTLALTGNSTLITTDGNRIYTDNTSSIVAISRVIPWFSTDYVIGYIIYLIILIITYKILTKRK